MESLLLLFIKGIVRGINALPVDRAVGLIAAILRIVVFFAPSHRKVAMRNLELVFPEKDRRWLVDVYERSLLSFARVVMDSFRLEKLDRDWVRGHVEFPMDLYDKYRREHPGKGLIIATGHLGSFDVMGHSLPHFGKKIAFVVRNFQLKKIDAWFAGIRATYGNRSISRKGALKGVLHSLKEGVDTAVLFDQNVRAEHGVFVDWFGIPAATTALPAIAAIRLKSPIVVCSMQYLGNDRYRVNAVECDCSDVYANDGMSSQEKIVEITRRISDEYQKMILANPAEWFWMHRRWRTRPKGDSRNIYA